MISSMSLNALRPRIALVIACGLILVSGARSVHAQVLPVKRELTTSVAPGCEISGPQRDVARRDNAESRRLAAEGQQAALVGDRTGARDALARAAGLNPGDERIAYDLGRAYEELSDTTAAVREYCRYLALSPEGAEAADVRSRLPALVSPLNVANSERALASFRAGLSLFDARRFNGAADAFSATMTRSPGAPEGVYNRAVAYAADGRRNDAIDDLQAYLLLSPAAEDRAAVTKAIEKLRLPSYNARSAFVRGLVPGFGQFYTNRPVRGVAALALTVGAGAMAVYSKTESREIPYRDPNGVLVPYTVTETKRPLLVPGVAAAVAITLGAALEASHYASKFSGNGISVSAAPNISGGVMLAANVRF